MIEFLYNCIRIYIISIDNTHQSPPLGNQGTELSSFSQLWPLWGLGQTWGPWPSS